MNDVYLQNSVQFIHFHFTATELYEDFCNLTEAQIKNALENLEEDLAAKFPSKNEQIREEIKRLEELYVLRSQESLQKFKEAAKAIFALPVNTEHGGVKVTNEEVAKLSGEVEELERKYQQAVFYKNYLQNEIKKCEGVESLRLEVERALGRLTKNDEGKPLKELLEVVEKFEEFYYDKAFSQREVTDVLNLFKIGKVE